MVRMLPITVTLSYRSSLSVYLVFNLSFFFFFGLPLFSLFPYFGTRSLVDRDTYFFFIATLDFPYTPG